MTTTVQRLVLALAVLFMIRLSSISKAAFIGTMEPRCVPSRTCSSVSEEASTHEATVVPHTPTVDLARDLIRIESVTPNDNGCQDMIAERLGKIGFTCEAMPFQDVSNLWCVRGDAKPRLVFAGHTDVVPTGPVDLWTFPPFSGTIDSKGMLHGRGAADMKGGVASFVVAVERFVERHPDHFGSIGLLLTSDEEGIARWGTQEVMSELARRGEAIDYCIVGEPTSHKKLGDTIKVGRRGSLSGELTVYGTQGHVAYPHLADNPLHNALAPLMALVNTEWDKGNENFPPTTFQISNMRGGTGATNVIPGHKTVHFNFRYSPVTNDVELKKRVRSILEDHDLQFKIDWSEPAYPYETKRHGLLVEAAQESMRKFMGLDTEISTSGGTSDGRFVAASGAQVVELGPINASIHKVDERVSTADLEMLTNIYEDILERVLCVSHVQSKEN